MKHTNYDNCPTVEFTQHRWVATFECHCEDTPNEKN